MDKSIHLNHLSLGVCYYPEHWDKNLWANDLDRMLEHGIETVRVFEFAWNVAEPLEGQYDFTLFDNFLDLAASKGMRVIMCTPTATPPAWLTHAYPEVLNADMHGNLMHHGHRRHYNYNSPIYRAYTEKIVTALGERYGAHPAIVGWQLDNELNCETNNFYSESDRAAFREYLKAHFGTLDALNAAIGARFWNQTYTSWDEVDMERPTIHNRANPHMSLLEKRFVSKSAISYAALQSDILRKYIGDRFITTNGLFGHLDNFGLVNRALDFITYDSYPNFSKGQEGINSGKKDKLRDRIWARTLSYARALSPNFGIMEQQSGANGWDFSMQAPMPLPGQMRLWTFQSVAHGADFVSYFRWRTAPYGTEIYWHGLNDYSNKPNRRMAELKRIHEDFERLADVAGSKYYAEVALVNDYLNEWDGERDMWHGPLDAASRSAIFAASQFSHTPLDVIYIRNTDAHKTTLDELKKYKVLIYPHATILTEDTAALLKAYCEAGGVLMMGARTGYKDEYGRCPMAPMPGFASELCGVEVIDYTISRSDTPEIQINWAGSAYPAPLFHDVLTPISGGTTLAAYQGGYFEGAPALVRKEYGNGGAAYYLGTGFSREMVEALLRYVAARNPLEKTIWCSEDIELALRVKEDAKYYFLLNYTGSPQTAYIKTPLISATTGEPVEGEITLAPYDVFVLKG